VRIDADAEVRLQAFRFLEEQTRVHPNAIPWRVLLAGFHHDGRRVPLVSQQGIFKPAVCRLSLSIRTAPMVEGRDRPYDDELGAEGLLQYRYRGTDRSHRENDGLRTAMREKVPIVYLYGVAEGWYVAEWPVFVVKDDERTLTFHVAVGDQPASLSGPMDLAHLDLETDAARRYATRTALVRLHQQAFRKRVLQAYRDRCAICRLRHGELLDAAHILPDGHPRGAPIVPNGLALCTLHHAAFDRNVLGVRPDLRVDIRLDVLEEVDGPMLQHGLQGFHGAVLEVPRSEAQRPRREFLEERYQIFRKAS
jgi:putative restriction endonuclease